MHVYAYAYMYMHMHMPKLQFLKLSGEVGGFAQRPPPHRCGVVGRAARCRTIPSPPLSRKAGNSGSFWGEKLREGKKKTKKQKTTPKKQENLRTFCCYTTRLSVRGVMWMGWKKNDPKSEAEKCSPFVNLSPTLNSGLI